MVSLQICIPPPVAPVDSATTAPRRPVEDSVICCGMRVSGARFWRAGAVLLALLLAPPAALGQRSPCPAYFQYKREGGVAVGEIEIPGIDYGTHTLRVSMSIKAQLPTSYRGEVKLLNESNLLKAIQSGGSVFYRVLFPLRSPLPAITAISYDGRNICTGPEETFDAAGQHITDISLDHTLRANLKSTQPTPPGGKGQVLAGCGLSKVSRAVNLVVGGTPTEPGDWPWLAALYLNKNRQYICTGSLVSSNVVITAAHCLYEKFLRPASAFFVELGVHNRIEDDSDKEIRNLRSLQLPPGHGGYEDRTKADVAALVLSSPVAFNDLIIPICLWSGSSIINNIGSVVGWGRDERGNKATPTPLLVKLPIVTGDQCRASPMLKSIDDDTQFCAGTKNPKKGPCTGDSGAGMAVWTGEHFELRGVVSFALQSSSNRECDLSNYVVFADAAKFSSWIQRIVTQNRA